MLVTSQLPIETTRLFYTVLTCTCTQGRIQGGRLGRLPPLKPTKATFFTMILYNLENSIRDIRLFCRPLFCHSSFVRYASSLLQSWTHNETWLPNIAEIVTPKIAGWIRPCLCTPYFEKSSATHASCYCFNVRWKFKSGSYPTSYSLFARWAYQHHILADEV